ncbi:PREDICTED: uncharacterized protein LOC106742366 isoform X2 [Dinoponera quadriceps]|nr:PREDICTED: uncharacterized protein LOC106742366 isoform X2 [Dinoponera quadriceps]XP_014470727.1 PREDICTED: uncharacterized protein LOC106742366 isoform X2 [Dinoponera quadriceps]XP_014470728.1 PREDICTED: uncharacterized protein LOC106742366 isoform X2 [Dinoponera quadriceps]
MKNFETKTIDMQPKSQEADVKLNVPVQEENIKGEKLLSTNKAAKVEEHVTAKEHVNVNTSEQTSSEPQAPAKTPTVQEAVSTESEIVHQEKEGVSSENISNTEAKEAEEQEENDVNLVLEVDQVNQGQDSVKYEEEKPEDKRSKGDKGEELSLVEDELKNGVPEKDEMQNELQTDTESSVEIVESTTSEVSETSEPVTQSNMPKVQEKIDDTLNDVSFISYDSSIMLKDIQIKLSDCLKDNSKLFDESNMEDTPRQFTKESFGKTLRNISGRHSINRMRHLGFYEKRISPNSSLFVNTSKISTLQDEELPFSELKALRYNSALSESLPTNGSSLDRKRKTDTPIWNSSKKQKSETESGLLNTPINLLKGWRRPIQVSTPNVTYKFESTKLDISGIKDDDNKITVESTESTKKWCVIM